MRYRSLLLSSCAASAAYAQSSQSIFTISGSASITNYDASRTGTYASVTTTVVVSSASAVTTTGNTQSTAAASSNGTSTSDDNTSLSSTSGGFLISGRISSASASRSSNATMTSSSVTATNTQPCNNYPEFCSRKYSNITEVCAHNSPFSQKNSAASNQVLDVTTQLDDGIRMLQGQVHYNSTTGSLDYCHTSCDLLNAGSMVDYLRKVAAWLQRNPYDVVTLMIGNADYAAVGNFTAPIQDSGLGRYVYTPPRIPMRLQDWPDLQSLILTGERVVVFMDYQANQTQVPYILDEFTQMWETPFSPTLASFPCTVDRPPKMSNETAEEYLYIANHNLNVPISLAGLSLLVPNTATLNETNAVSGAGSLGEMATGCRAQWNRPPNFLLVDYYNIGNGSVFEVAAQMNNVTYTRQCCGVAKSQAALTLTVPPMLLSTVLIFAAAVLLL